MGLIIFDGRSSKDYKIEVETLPNYETPEKDYEFIHIPGRNGDLVIDNGSYKNVKRSYNISYADTIFHSSFEKLSEAVSQWLNGPAGYKRLEDSYEPDIYRLAVFKSSINASNIYDEAGRTSIEFECKPQRFLKIGEVEKFYDESTVLTNPTPFAAKPIITVYGVGSGTLRIGDYICNISHIRDHITLNSDLMDAYDSETLANRNADISLPNGFPLLVGGENEITFNGDISGFKIIPNWWTL